MRETGALIADVLGGVAAGTAQDIVAAVRRRVGALTERFPLYSWKLARASA